ncbi:MAG: amidohydrolase, partial [Candidatus Dojkabacteria bacterium]|nr:amidohydrolase [Candidatus Dojkabacteria bacterium]
DIPLNKWLQEKIWPLEEKLTEEDVYWGAKLACLEMIKSGTTTFNDMYWHFEGTARAVEEMGLRAILCPVFLDNNNDKFAEEQIKVNKEIFLKSRKYSDRIRFALGPHAIYTVSEKSLRWIKKFADKNNLLIHIHVSETQYEVGECVKEHRLRPIEYLESINFLGPNVIAAHAVWLDKNEIKICKKYDVKVVYNPTSNLKLASGNEFPYTQFRENGVTAIIGTDGAASNNNLNIIESLKIASLIQKSITGDPTTLPAREALSMATSHAAEAFRLNAGKVEEEMLADLILVDLNLPELTPNHNLASNLIYASNPSCIDTVICDGKILMRNRKVKDEEGILHKASEVAERLVNSQN